MPPKVEIATRENITTTWPAFQKYRNATESHRFRGRVLNESDVRAVLEKLLNDVLGYDPSQIDREPDNADFVILYRDMKAAVIETKDWEAFRSDGALDRALLQASTYASRHHIRNVIAFDAETLVLGMFTGTAVDIKLEVTINTVEANKDLFYFTYYGLSKIGKSVLRSIEVQAETDATTTLDPSEYKSHHGVMLHYTHFAYVGDLRAKKTWKLPYRNPDNSVDTGRIDKAVSYLFRAGGYRGATASESSIPQAAQPAVARKLAIAYREIGSWGPDTPSSSAKVLWDYLATRGETDLN